MTPDSPTTWSARRVLTYAGLAAAVALVSGAALLSYTVTRQGQGMQGVIVSHEEAALDVDDQPGATTTLEIKRIVAPGPSWLVVSQVVGAPVGGGGGGSMGMGGPAPAPVPGAISVKKARVLAVVPVSPGEARNFIVKLGPDAPLTSLLLLTLHADRGIIGEFEYDADRFAGSPDKPYYREVREGLRVNTPLELSRTVLVRY